MENPEKSSKKILAINSNKYNLELLSEFLGKEGYTVDGISSIESSVADMLEQSEYSLALVDITGFDKNIWNFCEKLREKTIPFIVVSPKQITSIREQSYEHGAISVLVKPLVINELLALIKKIADTNS